MGILIIALKHRGKLLIAKQKYRVSGKACQNLVEDFQLGFIFVYVGETSLLSQNGKSLHNC